MRHFRPWFWLRLLRWHIGVMPDNGWPPLFSERYGYVKVYRAFGYKLKLESNPGDGPRFFGGWRAP